MTCEDGTRDSQRIVDADDRERTEIVTGVGHFGVAGGRGGTSSPVVVQDLATDAVTDNGIAMRLHIIYDCAGQSLNRLWLASAAPPRSPWRDRQLTACRPTVSVSVAK